MHAPLWRAGGAAIFQREGASVQYLSLVASKALECQPQALLLFLSAAEPGASSKTQEGPFLVAGPAGGSTWAPDLYWMFCCCMSGSTQACNQLAVVQSCTYGFSSDAHHADFLLQMRSSLWALKWLPFWRVGVVVGQADCKGRQNTLKRGSRLCS